MIQFNIIGKGFLDLADPSGVSFKMDNHLYRFCDISLGRSTEFSVPATQRNRKMLGFSDNESLYGEEMRRVHDVQMIYDGGLVKGTLVVSAYEGKAFKCVFEIHYNGELEQMVGTKIKDMALDHDATIVWDSGNIALTDTTQDVQLIMYDRDGGFSSAPPVPAINVKKLIGNLITPIGYGSGYPNGFENYWLIAGSMKGGDKDSITLTQTDYSNFSFSQVEDYIEVVNITLEWATANVFGFLVGGSSVSAKAFKAKKDLKMSFPASIPNNTYLIQYDSNLNKCKNLAMHVAKYGAAELAGGTVEIKEGTMFFLAKKPAVHPTPYYGWKDTDILTITVAVEVDRDQNLAVGETWRLSCNLPDMTFFDLLKSVALAINCDLFVDDTDIGIERVAISPLAAVDLDNVISVDKVARCVDAWGVGTKKASVAFDSDDYVEDPIVTTYELDNDTIVEEKVAKSLFSEGGQGANGVQVNDFDFSGSPAKFTAKKWTIAYAEDGFKYLQRLNVSPHMAYEDIADNSTAIVVKKKAPLSEFIGLSDVLDNWGFYRLYICRGVACVWTSASWSKGVMTLTLQRVSQLQS